MKLHNIIKWLRIVLSAFLFIISFIPITLFAQSLGDLIIDHHRLYIPDGDGQFPTLIAIPGCSGVSFDGLSTDQGRAGFQDDVLFRRHYPIMAERLKAEGYAVILIDVLSAEGVMNACNGEITGEQIAEYITEALKWSITLSFVDKDQIHLIGWSMGGWGVLTWLHDTPVKLQNMISSSIVVYPSCSNRSLLTAQIPLLMLLGGSDDIADPSICKNLVNDSPSKSLIKVIWYESARHGFDIEQAPSYLDIGNGMSIGYHDVAAKRSWQDILQFLRN